MKTSEFRKYLEENWNYEETEVYFEVNGLIRVNKPNEEMIAIWKLINTPKIIDLYKKAIEYTETPLEEREEEKKYRLKIKFNTYQYLNLNTGLETYSIDNAKEIDEIKTQFTQKEIDAMPFDTNFFIKEEV